MSARYGSRTRSGQPVGDFGLRSTEKPLSISISPAPSFTSNTPGNGYTYYVLTATATITVSNGGKADVLLVGGGGGGANGGGPSRISGAGGGAGGFLAQTIYLEPGSYTATVGAGGAGNNSKGSNTTLVGPQSTYVSIGGGVGIYAGYDPTVAFFTNTPPNGHAATVGGSGGGFGSRGTQPSTTLPNSLLPNNVGNMGNSGGLQLTRQNPTEYRDAGGGGGGAGSAGSNSSFSPWQGPYSDTGTGGPGGNGTTWPLEPPATSGTIRAGGGGGGNSTQSGYSAGETQLALSDTRPSGGSGGGGDGGTVGNYELVNIFPTLTATMTGYAATAGTANTGGGGGGGYRHKNPWPGFSVTGGGSSAANGGSGIIILRVVSS